MSLNLILFLLAGKGVLARAIHRSLWRFSHRYRIHQLGLVLQWGA